MKPVSCNLRIWNDFTECGAARSQSTIQGLRISSLSLRNHVATIFRFSSDGCLTKVGWSGGISVASQLMGMFNTQQLPHQLLYPTSHAPQPNYWFLFPNVFATCADLGQNGCLYRRVLTYIYVPYIHAHIISCSFQHSNAYHSNKFTHFMNLQNPEPYLKTWLTNSSGSITPAWCHLIRRDLIVIRHHGTAHDGGMQVCCFNNEAKGVGWRRFSVPDLMGQRRADRADGTSQSLSKRSVQYWKQDETLACLPLARKPSKHMQTLPTTKNKRICSHGRFQTCSCDKGSSRRM